ncbi:MAG: hypothetical protein QM767_02370 [Anaeromyxobacter sp.]
MSRAALLPLLLLALPVPAWAGDGGCRELQAFRAGRSAAPLPPALRAGFDRPRFLGCLARMEQEVRTLQRADVAVLERALAARGITGVEVSELDRLLLDPDDGVGRVRARLAQARLPQADYYRRYTLDGPLLQLQVAWTGGAPDARGGHRVHDHGVAEELRAEPDGRAVLARLLGAAREAGRPRNADLAISSAPGRPALTPAVAKLILFELLRERLRPADLRRVADQLRLKFDAGSPWSARVGDLDFVSVHAGYFRGAGPEHAPRASGAPASSGLDCTSVIQACLAEAGVGFPPGYRLLSEVLARLDAPDAEARVARPEAVAPARERLAAAPLEREDQLWPGDVVAMPGHAFVLAGWERDAAGRWVAVTYEAVGGEHRAFARFIRELEPAGAGRCAPLRFRVGERLVQGTLVRPRPSPASPAARSSDR